MIPRRPGTALLAALSLVALLPACKAGETQEPTPTGPVTGQGELVADPICGARADGSRHFQILHINDVYRIEGLADGRGGVARIRTLRRDLEAECDAVLVTHAGDTLFPSLLSREYDGAQMIEVLNGLDGDPKGFDERLLVTFGNHEFDNAKLKHAPMLDQRVEESQFAWVGTTVTWKKGEDGEPLVGADNLVRQRLMTIGGVKVGVFSLMTAAKVPAYVDAIDGDYVAAAKAAVADLRGQGAEVVLGLTHLDASDDRAVLESLPGADGPDLVLGGHDHLLMTVEAGGRAALKGDADGLRVRVVDMWIDADGKVGWTADPEGTAMGPSDPAADPDLLATVNARLEAFEGTFCGAEGPGCLSKRLTVAKTTLVAEELSIRRYETNFGDWIVDQMLATFAADRAEIAFINSGSLRLNQDIGAGTPITRQIIEETFAYPAKMVLLEVKGAVLQQVFDRAVKDWTGAGHWLQVGGLAYRHDVGEGTAKDLTWLATKGPVAIDPKRRYRVVVSEFLVDPELGDQDGYTLLNKRMIVKSKAAGTDLKQVVLDALTTAGDAGIGPTIEGRICSSDRPSDPCLAVSGS